MKLCNILKQQWAFTVPEARKKKWPFFNVITIVCNVNQSVNIEPLNEILCVHCLFSFRKFSWILSRTEFCILVVNELVNFLSVEQYAQFQLPRKIVNHHVVRFLYVFKAFTACRVLASRFISVYFWLTLPRKGSRISARQENNYCLCSRSSAVFHGFYLVQNFCICIECSKFLVSFNN